MGRRKLDFVWEHFNICTTKGKTEYFCKYCNEKYREKNVSKKRKHILKCQLCPKHVKTDVTKNYNALGLTTYRTKKRKEAESAAAAVVKGKKICSPKKITVVRAQPHFNLEGFSLNPAPLINTELVHEKLSRAVMVTSCPISLLEDPLWKKVWQALQPTYTPPTREAFENIYLDAEYDKAMGDLTTALTEADNLHIQCEKLSWAQSSSLIGIWIVTDKALFLKFVDSKGVEEPQSLYQELQNIINSHLSEKFLAVIGSEDVDVQLALEALKNRNDHLVSMICPLSILEQFCDVVLNCESVTNFFQKVSLIISSIYKNDLLAAVFAQVEGSTDFKTFLKLPSTNDYDSHLNCLENLLKCKQSLQQFAISSQLGAFFKESNNKQIKKLLLDNEEFWLNVEQIIEIIGPFVNLIKNLKEDAQIHKIKDLWSDLEKKVVLTLYSSFLQEEEKRKVNTLFSEKKFITPLHLAACLLDPSSLGANLTNEELLDATEFIDTIARNTPGIDSDAIMEDLGNFRCKTNIWSRQFVWKSAERMTPLTWWRGICSRFPLSKIATKILTAPAISVSSKKSETASKWMETGIQQGLTIEKIEKLVFISNNYKILNENDIEMKDDQIIGREVNSETVERVLVQSGENVQVEGASENDGVEYLEYEYIEDHS